MSALYAMRYSGQHGSSTGGGTMFVGKGVLLGLDVGGGRYKGTYTEQGGRLQARAVMSLPAGATLVTGQAVATATDIPLTADWPANFWDGKPQKIIVAGQPVEVTFEKIGDVP
jgi:hypothetical protein